MAWNEPGGNNNDPWGGNNQGPPDLDEALKKFQEKIGGLFGGGSGSGGQAPGFGAGSLGVVALIAAFVWAVFGFYQVDQQEKAVILRLGVYHDTVTAGLHWNPPMIDVVEKINVTKVRSAEHRASMLTEDENIVDVPMSVQYTVSDPAHFLLKVRNPEHSLEQAMESALRHVVGSSAMDQVITEGRKQMAIDVKQRLQNYLDNYQTGILVSEVNIRESRAPAQVQDAFDDVTRAKEDKSRLKNEAEAYANTIIPEARGAAQRQLEESNAYRDQVIARAEGEAARFSKLLVEYRKAPEVTRRRLYLDAMQDVYSNSTKVMVDVDGGNNMLYLPLDKIARSSGGSSSGNLDELDIQELTDRVVEQLRRESQKRRGEGR
ncbi:MAG TPA: FtsH protease activity modulator HflK [Spongiibacteraceae bacterium]|nr:FtsH protease activity modulator HflK [Spongiibacteraceae bacterium]HCS26324.1 FtsH protease activity modulator HflK [Spongiibacteraceae bacterium]|tara:strand:- start:422 stop:1549 length:1128 start_codon:yes stop_codon:yes gene_type:complete